jgi:transposase
MSNRTTFIGLDAHKRTITAAILRPGSRKAELITFDNTDKALARFVHAQEKAAGGPLRACYEAGPLGFGLQRTLEQWGLPTEVIAPAQMWKKPGDHIKTDRRDAEKLVRQLKADLLSTTAEIRRNLTASRDTVGSRARAEAAGNLVTVPVAS